VNALIALKEHMGSELLMWSYELRNLINVIRRAILALTQI